MNNYVVAEKEKKAAFFNMKNAEAREEHFKSVREDAQTKLNLCLLILKNVEIACNDSEIKKIEAIRAGDAYEAALAALDEAIKKEKDAESKTDEAIAKSDEAHKNWLSANKALNDAFPRKN